jgi:hypothetical protein
MRQHSMLCKYIQHWFSGIISCLYIVKNMKIQHSQKKRIIFVLQIAYHSKVLCF